MRRIRAGTTTGNMLDQLQSTARDLGNVVEGKASDYYHPTARDPGTGLPVAVQPGIIGMTAGDLKLARAGDVTPSSVVNTVNKTTAITGIPGDSASLAGYANAPEFSNELTLDSDKTSRIIQNQFTNLVLDTSGR